MKPRRVPARAGTRYWFWVENRRSAAVPSRSLSSSRGRWHLRGQLWREACGVRRSSAPAFAWTRTEEKRRPAVRTPNAARGVVAVPPLRRLHRKRFPLSPLVCAVLVHSVAPFPARWCPTLRPGLAIAIRPSPLPGFLREAPPTATACCRPRGRVISGLEIRADQLA